EDLEGVSGCVEFLNGLYRGDTPKLPERVAVIGDGNSAFDLARTLRRLGARVDLISWFPADMIPADAEEQRGAREEGVGIIDSLRVAAFNGENGKLVSLTCVRTRPGPPDKNGIPWPVAVEGAGETVIPCARAFVAIGQTGAEGADSLPALSESGAVLPGGENPGAGTPVLFGAGDAVNGPTSVVDAMASGRRAALNLLRCFTGGPVDEPSACRPADRDFAPIDPSTPRAARAEVNELAAGARLGSFAEVSLGFDDALARAEAGRCLQCGVCAQCLQCVEACGPMNAINHADTAREIVENAGVVILADPDEAARVKGDDVIRAYPSRAAGADPYSLMVRGFAAAARAMALLGTDGGRPRGHGLSFSPPDPGLAPHIRIGVFVCRCNDSLGWTGGMDACLNGLAGIGDIAWAGTVTAACVPDGYQQIIRTVREMGLTRVVLASCVCCSLNLVCSSCTDQRSRLKQALFSATGISRSMVEMVNIRGEALRLVKKSPSLAEERFASLIETSLRRARRLKPLPAPARNYNFASAVIGETDAVRTSALTLAESGFEVYYFDTSGGKPFGLPAHRNIHVFTETEVRSVSGTLGDFQVYYMSDGALRTVQAGTVILGKKSSRKVEYKHQAELPGRFVDARTQRAGETGLPFTYPGATPVPGLYIADIPDVSLSDREKGAAAAMLAAAKMPRGPRSNRGFTVVINEALCRGCGRCAQYCPYQAVSFRRNDLGGWVASVDDALCKGCGNCISVCPSNAADSPYRSHYFLEKVIEELLN
ncbi:MAG TPA: 4Fe-4S dicluster domain-containing protein, partial [Spirochaetes bacterium]|nr:4Fe-4S dicluster domain-containing protein [Spirochaetota bacterium]